MAPSNSIPPNIGELLGRLDPTSVDLTDLDVARLLRQAQNTTGTVATKATDLAKDAAYVTVGLGILGLQRAQVRRREFERSRQR
ncbi:MAG: hypothetical protein WBP59_04720 [Ilumatobacteraceae bacterium]